jgi:hypothetical protein
MRHFIMTVTALTAFGAMVATAQAENQTPSPPTASHPVKKWTASQRARPSQAKRANSYDVCATKAHDTGLVQGQAGRICYIRNCMGFAPSLGCH